MMIRVKKKNLLEARFLRARCGGGENKQVGDEDPADKDKHCLGFLQAAFRKPRY